MRLVAPFLALALTASTAMAGRFPPLPQGAPAGVKQAQMEGNTVLYVLLGAAVIAGIAIAASSGDSGSAPTPAPSATTTTTTTGQALLFLDQLHDVADAPGLI